MIGSRPLSLALLCLAIACTPEAEPSRAAQQAPAVPAFDSDVALSAWVDMWNSYDLSQVEVLFMPGAGVSYFSSEREGLISGLEAVRAHHEGFGFVEGGAERESRLWLEDVSVAVHGPVAVVAAIWYFDRDGSGSQVQKGPVTFVYAPYESGHRIVHANFSEYLPPQ